MDIELKILLNIEGKSFPIQVKPGSEISSEILCRPGISDPESLIYVLVIGKGAIGRVA